MTATTIPPKATRRERWAWYLYDFGNSAYAAVVLLAIYSAYFKGEVVGGPEGSRLWGLAIAIAMLFVAVTSPVLGAIADFSGSKKSFLLFFTSLCCVFTATLFFVRGGDVLMGMVFFILAEIGYRSSQVFYDALLPDIAEPDEIPSVSGKGWAIGSAGGIICLLVILPLVALIKGTFIIRLSMVITAVFFALSSIPLFVWLRERSHHRSLPKGQTYFTIGFVRLWQTLKQARSFSELIKFLIAFLIYNDGVIMALDFAAIIGAVLFGLNQQQLIIFVIIVQITNVLGAYAFGRLAESLDCKRSLILSIALMLVAVAWMFAANQPTTFFMIGALAGFAMAGVQSVSRSLVGVATPPERSAEFYGFFAVAGRTSSFIGPAVYGWVAAEAARWYHTGGQASELAEKSGQRLAILSIGAFLLVGMLLLLLFNEVRARAAARSVRLESS
ncbi:MAG: MFS transporter [Chloroflexi bacterium]|nr:MFS transporter [Chloroflexota bacterium]